MRTCGTVALLALAVVLAAGAGDSVSWGKDKKGSPKDKYENWYAKSYAVVIGIDEYPADSGWPRLTYAASDAGDMAELLAGQGFDVTLLRDAAATKGEVLRVLQEVLAEQVTEQDRFVLYFSGHGQSFEAPGTGKTLGYLIPFDGKREAGKDRVSTYVSMQEVKDTLEQFIKAKHKQVFVDSCFSGLIATKGIQVSGRTVPEDQKVEDALSKTGTVVVTAGDKDEPVEDGCLTRLLTEGLRGNADVNADGYVLVEELGRYVAGEVPKRCALKQEPFVGSLAGSGQMVFALHEGKEGKVHDAGGKAVAAKAAARPSAVETVAPAVEDGGPKIKSGERTTAVADLSVTCTPKEGVRFDLTAPNGEKKTVGCPYKDREAKPGKWHVKASATGYEAAERDFTAVPDDVTV